MLQDAIQNNSTLESVNRAKTNNLSYYAAFRSGCLGENILNVYFSFLANIIIEESWSTVDAIAVSAKFQEKYNFQVPLTFIRQVLGIGVTDGSITYTRGQYEVVRKKLEHHRIDMSSFEQQWRRIVNGFITYSTDSGFEIEHTLVEDKILDFIDKYDSGIVLNRDVYSDNDTDPFLIVWNKYLQNLSSTNQQQIDFISAICFSNILKQAVFYSGDAGDDFQGLNVYLDSPLIFALLGMDESDRVDSVKLLVKEMINTGCSVQILDHNLQEVSGIITNAGGWAVSANYDISKANNAARYFHDNQFDAQAIADFCSNIQYELSKQGIAVRETDYQIFEQQFQEDENLLYNMVEDKYKASGYIIPYEKQESIRIDVRSIIMLYRMRQGQVSQTLQNSKHIMLTLNGAVANVCKNYESNKSSNSGHIPVCVSADMFGTVLWMFHPSKMLEYHRKQLLADCYSILKPSKKILEKYVESLNTAKAMGEIDERRYLFMRSHSVVYDALMNVTKGDYARFNDRTYLEVYDEIVASSDKKFSDEVIAHAKTKKQLEQQIIADEERQERISILEKREKAHLDRRCALWSWLFTALLFGIPYIVILGVLELFKGSFQGYSITAIASVSIIVMIALILEIIFKKINKWINQKVRKYLQKQVKVE